MGDYDLHQGWCALIIVALYFVLGWIGSWLVCTFSCSPWAREVTTSYQFWLLVRFGVALFISQLLTAGWLFAAIVVIILIEYWISAYMLVGCYTLSWCGRRCRGIDINNTIVWYGESRCAATRAIDLCYWSGGRDFAYQSVRMQRTFWEAITLITGAFIGSALLTRIYVPTGIFLGLDHEHIFAVWLISLLVAGILFGLYKWIVPLITSYQTSRYLLDMHSRVFLFASYLFFLGILTGGGMWAGLIWALTFQLVDYFVLGWYYCDWRDTWVKAVQDVAYGTVLYWIGTWLRGLTLYNSHPELFM